MKEKSDKSGKLQINKVNTNDEQCEDVIKEK